MVVIAAVAFTYGIVKLLSNEKGWTRIESGSVKGISYDDELYFSYCLGEGDSSATAEYKLLTQVYNQTLCEICPLLDAYNEYDGVNNLYYINRHPNEEIEVDGLLYDVLAQINEYGVRNIYLAPVYEAYCGTFTSTYDAQAELYDPYKNTDLREYFGRIAAYAADESAVGIRLLGDNRIMLFVSGEYLKFAQDNGVTSFADMWLYKSAFIIDHCAKRLIDAGFTYGNITSYDGYMRNLDAVNTYAYELHTKKNGAADTAAVMTYDKPVSVVNFRTYAKSTYEANLRVYNYSNGDVRHDYIDISDGLCRAAKSEFYCYSYEKGCAQMALMTTPAFIAEELDTDALLRLGTNSVNYVYFDGGSIVTNDKALTLSEVVGNYEVVYD